MKITLIIIGVLSLICFGVYLHPRLTKIWLWTRDTGQELWRKVRRHASSTTPASDGTTPLPSGEGYGIDLNGIESVLVCLLGVTVIFSLLAIVIYWFTGSLNYQITIGRQTYTLNLIPILFPVALIYVLTSWDKVSETENGVKSFFGFMFQDIGPGPAFLPRWLCKIRRVPARVITLVGGTTEGIKAQERGEANTDEVSTGMLVKTEEQLSSTSGAVRVVEEPLRVTFTDKGTAVYFTDADALLFKETKNPLAAQLTIDPTIVLGLVIPKHGVRKLVRRFGSLLGALKEINQLMTSHLQILCSRVTPEYFVYRIDSFALMLQIILEKLLGDENIISDTEPHEYLEKKLEIKLEAIKTVGQTGVNIKSVRIETGLPKGVNIALKDAVQSEIAIQTAKNTGEADRIAKAKAGEGLAAAQKAMLLATADGRKAALVAEADGTKKMIEATDNPMGRLLAQLRTLETAMKDNSKLIIGPSGNSILGTIAGIKATLKQLEDGDNAKATPPTPTAPTTTGAPTP